MKYLVIGCGLTGATIARCLAEANREVVIWDRRNHIAGNMHDGVDEHGIRIHNYGPHVFHTDDARLWEFVQRFEEWEPFKIVCGATWDGLYTPTAFNYKTVDAVYPDEEAKRMRHKLSRCFNGRDTAPIAELLSHPDGDIRRFGKYLFDNDYAPYTAKQWGIDPSDIDPSVIARVPIRFSYEDAYFSDAYQAVPKHSYVSFFNSLLNHEGVRVELGVEATSMIKVSETEILVSGSGSDVVVIWTGALDELFGFRYGHLPYRSLRFEWRYENVDSYQQAPIVAYPKAEGYTRITEYKKLPPQDVRGTTIAIEYPLPYEPGNNLEPYYPVLTQGSKQLHERYVELANGVKNLITCGRLADFRYYNMDQALSRALQVASQLVEKGD